MEKTNKTKIAMAILALLLVSSIAMVANLAVDTASAQDYGDILQYEWPQAGADEGNTGWNKGPAPDRPNVLWTATGRGSGMVVAFDGMLFTGSGTTVYATDPFDGSLIYDSTCGSGNASMTSQNGIHKLDDTYFITTGSSGLTIRRISDGKWISSLNTPNPNRLPGSGTYFGGHFSDSMKMYFNHAYDESVGQAQIVAHDVSDPLNPTVAWKYPMDSSGELLCSGGGLVYIGSTEGKVMALDANGTRVWNSATRGGIAQQSGIYLDGKVYASAVSWQITCFDAETGERVWQAEKGIRGFSAYRGCVGDGMYFEADDALDPSGHITAWDLETGEQIWSQPAYFNIHYATMAYADGKVYGTTCDRDATAGINFPGTEFACFDAYTGTQLWKTSGFSFTYPSIAYGNLYGMYSTGWFSPGILYCIGGEPANWDHGLLGNVDHPQVSELQQAPSDISTPRWEFQTDGDVFSTPAIVDGKVYFGSGDKNWYCLDARTGEFIWNFTTGHYVRASCAVVGGRVFTGSEDGYFYALNAETGEQIWKVSGGGFFPYELDPNEADYRSSPVVVGGNVYCGSLDGKLYCLSTSDGGTRWTYNTGMGIHGSPLYYDNTIYITSTDGYLYAINSGGTLKWRSDFQLNMSVIPPAYNQYYNIGTPSFGDGMIFVGGGCQYGTASPDLGNTTQQNAYFEAQGMSTPSGANGGGIRAFAFNATTGESIWNVSRAGNTQPGMVYTYYDGYIYAGEFFEATKMDATNPMAGDYYTPDFSYSNRRHGNRTAGQWVGYQIQGSVLYAHDLSGALNRATDKLYVGSDIGSLYCLDASDLSTLSVFTAGANMPSSCAVWNGRLYTGATNGKLYCFDDSPIVPTSVFAAADKGATMWNNETINLCGTLTSYPSELVWQSEVDDEGNQIGGTYVVQPSTFTPPLPNQTVMLSLTNPDQEDITLTTTTDKHGQFSFSYSPTAVGDWGWVIYYDANVKESITYDASYGEWNAFSVTSPTAGGENPPPPEGGLPMEYVYVAVAVIVIVLVAIGIYFFMKRGK